MVKYKTELFKNLKTYLWYKYMHNIQLIFLIHNYNIIKNTVVK